MSSWKEDIELLPVQVKVLPDNNPEKPYYNPSLCWHEGKLLISIRSSTWTRDYHGAKATMLGPLHTDVMLGELDPETLEVKDLRKLKYAGKIHPFIQDIGMEDARIFVRDGQVHAIGVCMSKDDRRGESVHIAHGIVEGDKLVFKELLTKPHPERIEKNWTPPEVPSHLFDYIYSPTQTIKDGVLSGSLEYHGRTHGGSQALPWGDGWISFVHKIHKLHHEWDGFHQYVNYAMKYDRNGRATDISQGFLFFGDNQVEFISGAVKLDDKLLVSMGVGDTHCALAVIDPTILRWESFNPVQEPIRIYFDPKKAQATVQN